MGAAAAATEEVFDEFVKFRSCGIEEIKSKVMTDSEKQQKDTSVFIANKA